MAGKSLSLFLFSLFSLYSLSVSSPAVAISVQPADSEADPSDVEEDQELHEDDDASSKYTIHCDLCTISVISLYKCTLHYYPVLYI